MSSALKVRIDRLYQYSLDHRAKVGRFGSLVSEFTKELETRVSRAELEGVLEWHELIGSTPPNPLPAASDTLRAEVVGAIERFLSEVESRWRLAA